MRQTPTLWTGKYEELVASAFLLLLLLLKKEVCREDQAVNDISPFFRLKPFTSYQFRVKATNDIGDSEYSQESEAITTLQDGKTSCCN